MPDAGGDAVDRLDEQLAELRERARRGRPQ
jgi:hypothetical protein